VNDSEATYLQTKRRLKSDKANKVDVYHARLQAEVVRDSQAYPRDTLVQPYRGCSALHLRDSIHVSVQATGTRQHLNYP
jgi:hypothetical protein